MRNKKHNCIILCLCLCLCLTACGTKGAGGSAAPGAPASPAPWQPERIGEIAGEESAPPKAPEGAPDGLEGSYYNDYLRETLTLDGFGGCALSWTGGVMGGIYRPETDGSWTIQLADIRLRATVNARGDFSIDGKTGAYLRDWDFWGITPAEAGFHPTNTLPDTEEFALGGGAYRYRDFPAGLALTYDETLQLLPGRLADAVCIGDGKSGYVVGRNVTEQLSVPGRSAEEFLEDYIRARVFADFETLYGPVSAYEGLRILSGKTAGRLAAGEMRLSSGERDYAARAVLYTSVYPDGTENFICKCILAPAEETGQLEALERSVYDMGAARIVQTS